MHIAHARYDTAGVHKCDLENDFLAKYASVTYILIKTFRTKYIVDIMKMKKNMDNQKVSILFCL